MTEGLKRVFPSFPSPTPVEVNGEISTYMPPLHSLWSGQKDTVLEGQDIAPLRECLDSLQRQE